MPTDEVQVVYEAWRARRPHPGLVTLTKAREAAIRARLREHTAQQLVVLVAYAHEANTGEARFWRGDSEDGREYMDLVNLLRASKTASRVERAWAWRHQLAGAPREVEAQHGVEVVPDVNLGPMAAFHRPPPAQRLPPAGQPVVGRVPRRK